MNEPTNSLIVLILLEFSKFPAMKVQIDFKTTKKSPFVLWIFFHFINATSSSVTFPVPVAWLGAIFLSVTEQPAIMSTATIAIKGFFRVSEFVIQ